LPKGIIKLGAELTLNESFGRILLGQIGSLHLFGERGRSERFWGKPEKAFGGEGDRVKLDGHRKVAARDPGRGDPDIRDQPQRNRVAKKMIKPGPALLDSP
jgi:hypothetical protein